MSATINVSADARRLSPWSIFHYVAKTLTLILQNAYILIAAAFGATIMEIHWIGWMLLPAVLVGIIGAAYLTFVNFHYQILGDSIQVKKGILFKNETNLAFTRIQNINIEHPFYFRPLGLVTLKIDGAGSAGEEIYLSALQLDAAQQIREEIELARSKLTVSALEDGSSVENSAVNTSSELPFYSRSTSDLVIHGLTNNRAWIVVGGLFVFYEQVSTQVETFFVSHGIDLTILFSNQSIAALTMWLLASLVLAVGIMAGLSVLISIFTYANFTLLRSETSLIVRRGLLNKHEIQVQKSRVQTIYLHQDWLDLVLGRLNLIYEQISHSPFGEDMNNVKLLVPSVKMKESPMLINEVFSFKDVSALTYTPVSKRHFYKSTIIWSLLYTATVIIFITSRPDLMAPAIIMLLPWSLHLAMLYMSWKRKGLAIEKDLVIARSGIIGINYIIFPSSKLQEIKLVQTPLMKRKNLANLHLTTASRTSSIPYLDQSFARSVIDYCLYQVESTNKSWM